MARHTQAHISRTIDSNKSRAQVELTKRQMKYYMGAKLIEIGVNPKSAIYRWAVAKKDNCVVLTLSAYWGESKQRLLTEPQPLTGAELIDCARANASRGIESAASLCGYGKDVSRFQEVLKQASNQMGLQIESLSDLLGESPSLTGRKGIEVAPDTSNSL